jgi:hypothetical protein
MLQERASMPNEIDVASLTTCLVTPGGQRVRLNFEDSRGRPATLSLPSNCVQQLVMTLPHLLSTALKAQHGDRSARAVFPLDEWRLETVSGSNDLILTLKTPDGFEVAFTLSPATLAQITSAVEEHQLEAAELPDCLAS